MSRYVAEMNAVLRGWGAYFRVGNTSRQFALIDRYARERLGRWLSKKAGRSGRAWKTHTVGDFLSLGLHQLSGTVAWATATPTVTR